MKKKVSIMLDWDIAQKLEQWAIDSERSFSQYVNLLLREYLKELEKNPIPLK